MSTSHKSRFPVLLPKSPGVEPLCQKKQRFSSGNPILEGERVCPYALREPLLTGHPRRNWGYAPFSHDEEGGPGRLLRGDRTLAESNSASIFTVMIVKYATAKWRIGAIVCDFLDRGFRALTLN
jgi:hypothetical protein